MCAVADPGGVPGVPWNPLNFAKCAAEKYRKISCHVFTKGRPSDHRLSQWQSPGHRVKEHRLSVSALHARAVDRHCTDSSLYWCSRP